MVLAFSGLGARRPTFPSRRCFLSVTCLEANLGLHVFIYKMGITTGIHSYRFNLGVAEVSEIDV